MAKVVKFPAVTPTKFGLQKVSRRSGKKDAQLNLFAGAKVVSLNPHGPFEEALLLDEAGDLEKAARRYAEAIEQADSVADAHCNLGILEWQKDNLTRAIDQFTLALREDPRHYEAHYNLANLYAEAGNYMLAKVHYQVSIEIEPSFPNCYFNLGLTLAMNNEYKEAIAVLRKYLELSSSEDTLQVNQLVAQLESIAD